jgi:hypothetical protein
LTEAAPQAGVALSRRLIHLHIPKTAGAALRTALSRAGGGALRVCPQSREKDLLSVDRARWDIFSGHFGFDTARSLDGDIITVLRDPVDRFVSVYYFWRQIFNAGASVNRKTGLAHIYTLDDFAMLMDEPFLIEEFFNRITWQLAYGSSLSKRAEMHDRGMTEAALLAQAEENAGRIALIGFQDRLDNFNQKFAAKFGFGLKVNRKNVTTSRLTLADLPSGTRARIERWLYLDIEFYQRMRKHAGIA